MTRTRRAWVALAVVAVSALSLAALSPTGRHPSPAKRADTIARGVRCPTCRGQSVAESAAPAAQAVRTEIRRRIDAGQSRVAIESYLVGRYGTEILLTPPNRGIGSLVWAVPMIVATGAAAALGLALRRWSRRSLAQPTDADRALVSTSTTS